MTLDRTAEMYARATVAVADAFISCWYVKYKFCLLRPETYIQRVIDPTWTPLIVTPPFPEYASGHSVQSKAAADVLTDMFGDMAFFDHTHDDRGLAPRWFASFRAAAAEAAISRVYGGIHYPMGVAGGIQQGACVARKHLDRIHTH